MDARIAHVPPFLKKLRPSLGMTVSGRNQLPIRRSNPRPHPGQRVGWSLGDECVNAKAFSSDKLCGNVADAQPAPARQVESTVFPSRGVFQDYEIVVGRQDQQLPVRGSLVAGRPRLRGHTLDLELRRDRPLAISGVSDPKEHPTGSVAEAVPWLWWLVMPAARSTIRRSHDYMNAGFALQLTAWNGRPAPAHSASSPIFRSRAVTCTSYARRHQPASACLDRPHILKFV